MSIQKPLTAAQKARRKAADKKWADMTPAQKKRARQASTPHLAPSKKSAAAATKAIKKLVQAKKKTKK